MRSVLAREGQAGSDTDPALLEKLWALPADVLRRLHITPLSPDIPQRSAENQLLTHNPGACARPARGQGHARAQRDVVALRDEI